LHGACDGRLRTTIRRFPIRRRFDFDREVVLFFGQDGKTRIRCAISKEALDDDLRADKREKVEVFRENRKVIEEAARRKYLAGDTETTAPSLSTRASWRSRRAQRSKGYGRAGTGVVNVPGTGTANRLSWNTGAPCSEVRNSDD
jgi:hypothetical protein